MYSHSPISFHSLAPYLPCPFLLPLRYCCRCHYHFHYFTDNTASTRSHKVNLSHPVIATGWYTDHPILSSSYVVWLFVWTYLYSCNTVFEMNSSTFTSPNMTSPTIIYYPYLNLSSFSLIYLLRFDSIYNDSLSSDLPTTTSDGGDIDNNEVMYEPSSIKLGLGDFVFYRFPHKTTIS